MDYTNSIQQQNGSTFQQIVDTLSGNKSVPIDTTVSADRSVYGLVFFFAMLLLLVLITSIIVWKHA